MYLFSVPLIFSIPFVAFSAFWARGFMRIRKDCMWKVLMANFIFGCIWFQVSRNIACLNFLPLWGHKNGGLLVEDDELRWGASIYSTDVECSFYLLVFCNYRGDCGILGVWPLSNRICFLCVCHNSNILQMQALFHWTKGDKNQLYAL